MLSASPVSQAFPETGGGAGEAQASLKQQSLSAPDEEDVDVKLALFDDPIVGVEVVTRDEHGPGALEARALPSPPTMTPTQRATHALTHVPPHQGCAICRSTRSPNMAHGPSHEHERVIPLLVGDYCFMRRQDESKLLTCLVMRLYPYKIFLACGIPKKGIDALVISRISRFIREMGLVHFAYRCDRETALNAHRRSRCTHRKNSTSHRHIFAS